MLKKVTDKSQRRDNQMYVLCSSEDDERDLQEVQSNSGIDSCSDRH